MQTRLGISQFDIYWFLVMCLRIQRVSSCFPVGLYNGEADRLFSLTSELNF